MALAPPRTLGFASLVGITFFCVAGGAYGLEDAVGAAGPAWALLAILVVPWLWSLPMALMTPMQFWLVCVTMIAVIAGCLLYYGGGVRARR